MFLLPAVALCDTDARAAGSLEEIIVTARKMPEDVARVPLSVQLLSGDFLDRRNLSDAYDLQFEIPGLVINNRGMFGAGFALRGVTDDGGGSLAIAPHINGVYLGRSNLLLARQFDVARIEVVKGPQGTLYGRNATGGSINVITRAPAQDNGAALEAAVGNFNSVRFQGHVNGTNDKVAARIAVAGAESDGLIRNTVDGRRFAADDYFAVRASLRARPSPNLTVDVMAEHVADDGASGELWLPRRDFLPNPNDLRLTTVTLGNPHLVARNDIATVDIAYDFSRLTLRSITGYARTVTDALDDCAGSPPLNGCVRGVQPLRQAQLSQELRLQSLADSTFVWLLGGYFFDADETQRFTFSVPGIGSRPINDYTATSDETAYALFGDVTHALGKRWRVSGGLRLSHETQRFARAGSGTADRASSAADGSWDNTSWRAGIEYAPSESLMWFANVATGFKSGGVTTALLPNGEFDDYGPETLRSIEAGVSAKSSNRPASFRATAFFYDFKDMQVGTIAILANRISSVIDNAAAARILGLDLSASALLGTRLRISGGLVWLPRREFVEFITASTGANLSGNKISRAPEWSAAASVSYRLPVASAGELVADLDYHYRSRFFFTKENEALFSQAGFGLTSLGLRFEPARGKWYAFATARNVFDKNYFNQLLIQSAPGSPARYELGFGWKR